LLAAALLSGSAVSHSAGIATPPATGGSGTPDDDSVTSAKILDGEIVDADVSASAGIVGTKIAAGTTTARGTLELATDGEVNAAEAVNAADSRLDSLRAEWGIVGTESSETTWDKICAATSIEFAEPADGGPWRDYWFDPSTGNDTTGDGSLGNPWQTPDRMRAIITQVGCGVRINITGGSAYTATNDATSFDSMNPICANADGVGAWIRSTTSAPVTIQCSGAGPTDAVIGADGTDANAAWLVTENIVTSGCTVDLYDTANNGKLLAFVPPGSTAQAVTGAQDNLVTSHHDSQIIAIGVHGTTNGSGTAAQPVAITGDSSGIFACSPSISSLNTSSEDLMIATSGTGDSPTIIAERVVGVGTGAGNRTALELNTISAGTARALLFRSLFHTFSGTQPTIRILADAATQIASLGLYGVTCADLSGSAHCLDNTVDTTSADSTLTLTARGLLIDNVTAKVLNFVSGAGSTGTVNVDIQESVWDDDDVATSFTVGGGNFATRALAAADPEAAGWNLFTSSTEISSGVQWVETITDPQRACATGRECKDEFATEISVSYGTHAGLSEPICIPKSIAPGRICSRKIGGTNVHAGAR